MADRFGQDFNAARPGDADYAQRTTNEQGAQVLRNLKFRIKTFFTKLFDLESMDFHDAVIPSSALLALDPDPSATGYREMTVNRKGQVIRGKTGVVETGPQPYRAIMYADTTLFADDNFQETSEGLVALTPLAEAGPFAADSSLYYVIPFEFFVPTGVTRLKFHLAVKWADEYIDGTVEVSPGDKIRIELWNRQGSGTSGHSNIILPDGTVRRTGSGGATAPFGTYFKGSENFYSGIGAGKGFCILEWYA
jgi:hypothetical protein